METQSQLDRLILILTDYCDSRCRACKIWQIAEPESLAFDRLRHVLQTSTCLRRLKRINLSGGEPFFYSRLNDLLWEIRDRWGPDLLISCITSGWQTEKIIDFAAKAASSGKLQLFVSLDGIDEVTYNRTRGGKDGLASATTTIRKLAELRETYSTLRTGVSFTIMKQNLHQLEEVHSYTTALGIDFITRVAGVHSEFYRVDESQASFRLSLQDLASVQASLNRIVQRSSSLSESHRHFFQNMETGNLAWRDYICHAGTRSCCIRANGNVVSCLFSEWVMGNIYRDSLDSVIESDSSHAARQNIAAFKCSCWNDSETLATYEYNKVGDSPRAGW